MHSNWLNLNQHAEKKTFLTMHFYSQLQIEYILKLSIVFVKNCANFWQFRKLDFTKCVWIIESLKEADILSKLFHKQTELHKVYVKNNKLYLKLK